MNPYLDIPSPAQPEAGRLASVYGLENHGLSNLHRVYWNLPTAALYEEVVFRGEARVSHLGPMVVTTGKHTARAAADKFVVREQSTENHVWWGEYNRPFSAEKFSGLLTRMQAFYRGGTYSCRIATPAQTRIIACRSASLPRRHGTASSPATCS